MILRSAKKDDLPDLVRIGNACYTPQEAASESDYRDRLEIFPDHFWILEDDGEILSFINGPATDYDRILDVMYHRADYHAEHGAWQAILGVNTAPAHQGKGYASMLLERMISDVKKQNRKGCILTCKAHLIPYYEKFGFKNEGVSSSVLADQVWYDMRLSFSTFQKATE